MEGHPIPQDITGFQFRLIGDMTIKQFIYVAIGAVLAWAIFSLPIFGIIKLPLAAVVGFLGAGFAFLPIGGRPMDVMAINFMKALFSSSQYVYQKGSSATLPEVAPVSSITAPAVPIPVPIPQATPPVAQDIPAYSAPFMVSQNSVGKIAPSTQTPLPPVEEEEKNLEQKEEVIEKELQVAKTDEEESQNSPTFEQVHQKVLDLEKLLQETVAQRQELEKQIMELHQKLNSKPQEAFTPSVAKPVVKETQNVRSVPENLKKTTGVPITPEFPNLLTGIVKDPRGNPLPNILVEVKDKDGNPVRALKTNGLGQFSAATPLTNGTYYLSFEDSRGQGKFDSVQIVANGEIIMPLEIISQDAREELRKALFS